MDTSERASSSTSIRRARRDNRGVAVRDPLPVEVPHPGRYRHFKGGEYEVLDVARHSETDELLVVYRSLDEPDRTWVRPVEMFSGDVDGPNGVARRFERTLNLRSICRDVVGGLRRVLFPSRAGRRTRIN